MRSNETKIRTHGRPGSGIALRRIGPQGLVSLARRNQASRGGIQASIRVEPQAEGTQAEIQTFRLGPRGSRALEGFLLTRPFLRLASQFRVGETLAHDLANEIAKAIPVAHWQSVVKAERLFVNIAEQVKRFDRNIGSADGPFQETPEVLHAIGVDVAVHERGKMVHDHVFIFIHLPLLAMLVRMDGWCLRQRYRARWAECWPSCGLESRWREPCRHVPEC